MLFIDGNHENFDKLNSYPVETWCGGKVHKIRNNVIHLMCGEVYCIEGNTIERRYDENATIFCTQYKFEDWHARLGGGVLADSIMDRVVHRTISVYSGDLNMREFLATHDV